MLLGQHDHSLDEKNRLTLPARLRGPFEDGVVVNAAVDGCLQAYPRATWERFSTERLEVLDPFSADTRLLQRYFFAGATNLELDRQGRLVLSAQHVERAGLQRDVTVIGLGDHLEIWDRATWRQKQLEIEGRAEDVAERLAQRD